MALGTEHINEVKSRHVGNWFDTSTMRFFNSRVSSTAYLSADSKRSFFVSSEKGPHGPRMYSTRVQDCATGKIDTVGEFQGYSTGKRAHIEAEWLSKQEGDLIQYAYVKEGYLAGTYPKIPTFWIEFSTLTSSQEFELCLHIETREAAEQIKQELLGSFVLADQSAADRPYGEVYKLARLPYRIKLQS